MQVKLLTLNLAKEFSVSTMAKLTAQRADIYCFQEAWDRNQPIISGTSSLLAPSYKKKGMPCGVRTSYVSSLELMQHGFALSDKGEIWRDIKKAVQWARFERDGRSFWVINIHGNNDTPFRRVEPLISHLLEVDRLCSQDLCPVIFAGDFNTLNEKRMKAVNEWLTARGFSLGAYAATDNGKILDMVWTKGCQVTHADTLNGMSDHPAIVANVHIP